MIRKVSKTAAFQKGSLVEELRYKGSKKVIWQLSSLRRRKAANSSMCEWIGLGLPVTDSRPSNLTCRRTMRPNSGKTNQVKSNKKKVQTRTSAKI